VNETYPVAGWGGTVLCRVGRQNKLEKNGFTWFILDATV
jgi:hypothetical protein